MAGIVTTADIKTHLQITVSSYDTELGNFCLAASDACEAYTGRVWRSTTVTAELHDGGQPFLRLRTVPVASVTTVVEYGTTLTAADYVLDGRLGWLYRGGPTTPLCWLDGRQSIAVTYVAAPPGPVPYTITHGVLEMVRHLWETQRGGTGLPRTGPDGEWDPSHAYSIPRRVAELWDLSRRGPLVA